MFKATILIAFATISLAQVNRADLVELADAMIKYSRLELTDHFNDAFSIYSKLVTDVNEAAFDVKQLGLSILNSKTIKTDKCWQKCVKDLNDCVNTEVKTAFQMILNQLVEPVAQALYLIYTNEKNIDFCENLNEDCLNAGINNTFETINEAVSVVDNDTENIRQTVTKQIENIKNCANKTELIEC